MADLQLAAAAALLAAGAFFMVAAALAVLRLPDPLSRLHGVTKAETAGLGLMLAGAVVLEPSWRAGLLAAAAWIATAGAGAAASHMIAVRLIREEQGR
ncbi:MAG: monovalent cation/H(+) antiporter subunit G [Pseudomonadota bacterium]